MFAAPTSYQRSLATAIIITAVMAATMLVVSAAAQNLQFTNETVGGGSNIQQTALAFDGKWTPHVLFMTESGIVFNYDIWYTHRLPDGTWLAPELVTTAFILSTTGERPELDVFEDGTAHVAYVDAPGGIGSDREVTHVARIGGVWGAPSVIASVNNSGNTYIDLDVDPAGFAHVSYHDDNTDDLWYAGEHTGFALENVDPGPAVGEQTSIVNDDPDSEISHIAYFNQSLGELWYARREGATWNLEAVDGVSIPNGQYNSIDLDPQGNPHIAYVELSGGVGAATLKYARRVSSTAWTLSVIDANAPTGFHNSLAIDHNGIPHVSYVDLSGPRYAKSLGAIWQTQEVGNRGTSTFEGAYSSIALDRHGNPNISHQAPGEAIFRQGGVHLRAPHGGATWTVGDNQTIRWSGAGMVDLLLSVDAGKTWDTLAMSLFAGPGGIAGSHTLRVPHAPSKFCMVKVRRSFPWSESVSDSLFTISANIALLNFVVQLPTSGNGFTMTWETDPGPDDVAGYRLDRARRGTTETLVALTRETHYHDPNGIAGDSYRLYAVNGLGDEFYMGAATAAPALTKDALSAWPLPYHGGELTIAFGAFGSLGSSSAQVDVSIYDVRGRLVDRIAHGSYFAGTNVVTWDGNDRTGTPVASGVYFIISDSSNHRAVQKITVVR